MDGARSAHRAVNQAANRSGSMSGAASLPNSATTKRRTRPEVLAALKAASDAGNLARSFCNQLRFLIRKAVDADRPFDRANDSTDEIERVINETRQAVRAANDRDDALIDVIRADLQGEHGRALAVLNPPSPQTPNKVTRDPG